MGDGVRREVSARSAGHGGAARSGASAVGSAAAREAGEACQKCCSFHFGCFWRLDTCCSQREDDRRACHALRRHYFARVAFGASGTKGFLSFLGENFLYSRCGGSPRLALSLFGASYLLPPDDEKFEDRCDE